MKQILLIEDNLEMRENTAEILELADYQVTKAENGRVGIEKARESKPDLIICDIMMPEMDGYAVLLAVSMIPTLTTIPFIFLTAKAENTDFRKGMSLGADDYLTKPYDDVELLGAVETRLKKNEFIKKEYERNSEGFSSFVNEVKNFPDLKDLSTNYQVRKYPKKNIIYHDGAYPRFLYLINNGTIKTARSNDDGKEFITGIYKPGDFIGYASLIEDKPYTDSAETLETTELALIPREDFIKLFNSNRQVSSKFIKLLTADITASEEKLLKLAYDSVRQRVAHALIDVVKSNKLETATKPIITLSREDLGNMAGTATESAIRALKDLKDDGLIDIDASRITVLNYHKLTNMKF